MKLAVVIMMKILWKVMISLDDDDDDEWSPPQ